MIAAARTLTGDFALALKVLQPDYEREVESPRSAATQGESTRSDSLAHRAHCGYGGGAAGNRARAAGS